MKEIRGLPPNIEFIRTALPSVPPDALFCYGGIIYNPGGREITPDLELHESIHSRQQGSNPDAWYSNYLTDPVFRLSQEIEAYGEQYAFAKQHIEKVAEQAHAEGKVLAAGKTKLLEWALDSMATALSGEAYGSLLTYGEAKSKIRNYSR